MKALLCCCLKKWRPCFDGRTTRAISIDDQTSHIVERLFAATFLLFFSSKPKKTDTSCRHSRKRKPEEELGGSRAFAPSTLGVDPTEAFSTVRASCSSFLCTLFFSLSCSYLCSSAPPLTCLSSALSSALPLLSKGVSRPLFVLSSLLFPPPFARFPQKKVP